MLDTLERENRLGIVMLGRVYHHDPGLNHEIMEEFQKLGYPVFSQSFLPTDEDLLDRLFGEEVRSGSITHALDIRDVWKNAYSGQHQPEDLGGEVHGAPSQSGCAGDQ
jgi:predicted nucleotide-binding protein (sugar kinase/HSP70/actin superfamily)